MRNLKFNSKSNFFNNIKGKLLRKKSLELINYSKMFAPTNSSVIKNHHHSHNLSTLLLQHQPHIFNHFYKNDDKLNYSTLQYCNSDSIKSNIIFMNVCDNGKLNSGQIEEIGGDVDTKSRCNHLVPLKNYEENLGTIVLKSAKKSSNFLQKSNHNINLN